MQQAAAAPVLTGGNWLHARIGTETEGATFVEGNTPVAFIGDGAARILPAGVNLALAGAFSIISMPGAWVGQMAGIATGRLISGPSGKADL